jgi:helicase MOV-10
MSFFFWFLLNRLASANFPAGHFSHVFIDESGQAIEPEALIAVAGILTVDPGLDCGQLVLAGDPQQLGPILRSPIAQQYGLGKSEQLIKVLGKLW